MPYEYGCEKCKRTLRSYVEPTYTYPYCVACKRAGCGHREPRPEVYCFDHGRMTERKREEVAA